MSGGSFDVIVIGLGGVGSAVAAAIARKGLRVLGIDQFDPPHRRGSSHGQTRIIRQAYFEHPNYVPLLRRAYELWQQLETECDQRLYFATGLLQIGPADGPVLSGIKQSAVQHELPIDEMSLSEAQRMYPGVEGQSDWIAIVEHNAGYLLVEQCVKTHLQLARKHGATMAMNETVQAWRAENGAVSVTTNRDRYTAGKLVIAAGPWADHTLRNYSIPLTVIRKHVYWYRPRANSYQSGEFPCFFFDTPAGFYYGMPDRLSSGLKVGRHSGGSLADPAEANTHPRDPEDQQAVESFLSRYLPQMTNQQIDWSGCFYTMTPDQHFVVDRLPDAPQVTVIAGLSGHGFKFTSVLGEIAGHWASEQHCPFDLEFLRMDRF